MKTAIYAGLFIDSQDWLDRAKKFIDYYRPLKKELGFTEFCFLDNGSKSEWLKDLVGDDIHISHFEDHWPKGRGARNYPYGWRNLYEFKRLFESRGITKAIIMDTDVFILTQRLMDYIRNCNDGWWTFWCAKYAYPSAELEIFNMDALPLWEDFTSVPMQSHFGKSYENVMPYSVNTEFNVGRWGEDQTVVLPFMDAYTQCPTYFNIDDNRVVDPAQEIKVLELELKRTRRTLNDYRVSAVKATQGHTLSCLCNYCLTLAKHGGV